MNEALKKYRAIVKGIEEIYGNFHCCLRCGPLSRRDLFEDRIPEYHRMVCQSECDLYACIFRNPNVRVWNNGSKSTDGALELLSALLKEQDFNLAELVKKIKDSYIKSHLADDKDRAVFLNKNGNLNVWYCLSADELLRIIAEML